MLVPSSWEWASRFSGGAEGASRRTVPPSPRTSKETARGGVAFLVKETVAGVLVTFPALSCAVMENVHVPSLSSCRVETKDFGSAEARTTCVSTALVVLPSLKSHEYLYSQIPEGSAGRGSDQPTVMLSLFAS